MTFFRYALVALSLFPSLASAQDATQDIVVTASGVDQPRDEVGQAITVIDAATIETRQQTSVSDLLATTSGVSVSRSGGVGAQTSVRIRGGEAAQTLVVVDGVRVNDPSDPSGAYDFGNLLTDTISRIEILRGPNAVAWGSQAIGGVVEVTTQAPTEALSIAARGSYGDLNTSDGALSASLGSGPIKARIGGSYYNTDGISAVASGTEPDGYEHYGATARIDATVSPAVALDLRGYWTHNRLEFDDGFTPADSNDRSVVTQLNGYAGLKVALFDGALRNRVAVSVADVDRSYDGSFAFQAHGRSVRAEYAGDARVASWLRLVFGAENEWSHLRTHDDFSGQDRRSTRILSGYAQLLLTPFSGLSLTGGIRHDDHQQFGGKTTFGANAAWTFGGTTLRSSYAEGFKAPTLSQLYGFGGDPGLRPETANSIDIGIEQRLLDNRLKASATWFRRRSSNLIVSDPATFQLSNIAQTNANGAEFELTAMPIPSLQLSANYTHLRSIDRTPGGANFGRDLQYRPRDMLSASLDGRVGPVSLGGTFRLVGDSFDDRANARAIDGYAVVDLRARVALGRNLELFGRVDNVFDARYEVVSNYANLGRNAHIGIGVKL